MKFELPDFSVIVLIGASGSGKSTFAAKHFLPTEILSSDHFRALVSDDETNQSASKDAFEALHHLASIRLRRRLPVVIDATNVQSGARKPLIELARKYHAIPVAVVIDVPEKVCLMRNAGRPNRDFGRHVVERHVRELRMSLRDLQREGFRTVIHLRGESEIDAATFARVPLRPDRRTEHGPFDIIGDVHGCYAELCELLTQLGYVRDEASGFRHPEGRRVAFVGDLVDRGPQVVETIRLTMAMVRSGTALCVPGNHDDKLKRAFSGRQVVAKHGLQESLEQIERLPEEEQAPFGRAFADFVEDLPTHLYLDDGKLVVAHAGLPEEMQGRSSGAVRSFALYGDTTGESDDVGLPVRLDWAKEYRGKAAVVYGHTPITRLEWVNNAINIDTGCVFGGKLTALRYPERETVSVNAHQKYAESARPLVFDEPETISGQWAHDDVLDIADYVGRKTLETRLHKHVVIAEENAAAALEIMSRFAVHPRWLCYLPPTMSPVNTSKRHDYLEYPEEAFSYFADHGVTTVLCEEKHMGSRAVMVVCRNEKAAHDRFGVVSGEHGAIFTRTGRPFFNEPGMIEAVLGRTATALEDCKLWDELQTDWVCLDAEIMPWNAKAQSLLQEQYAPVAAAGVATLAAEVQAWEAAAGQGLAGADEMAALSRSRLADLEAYRMAYGRYCWPFAGIDDLKIAPFHLLAAEGKTFFDRPHDWHLAQLARLAGVSSLFHATANLTVHIGDDASEAAGALWWEEKTVSGSEGMVVKPMDFIVSGCQPAIKVRGREYLRIIYGPEYTASANIERLRSRGVQRKRSLATREFALGVEALERFVRREPLRRVHECVFAVLALESEPVDPRL